MRSTTSVDREKADVKTTLELQTFISGGPQQVHYVEMCFLLLLSKCCHRSHKKVGTVLIEFSDATKEKTSSTNYVVSIVVFFSFLFLFTWMSTFL